MRRALLSVYDKTGVAAFAGDLRRLGFELLASGGTAKLLAADGIPVQIERACDVGRFRIVDTRHGEHLIKLLVAEGQPVPEGQGCLAFDPARTRVYADGWAVA